MKLFKGIGFVLIVILLFGNLAFSRHFDLIPGKSTDELRILKLKVVADEGYRQYVPDWQEEITELIQKASAIIEPQTGLKLEVIGFENWPRKIGEYKKSDDLIYELFETFPRPQNADFDLVVGLTSDLDTAYGCAKVDIGYIALNCKDNYKIDGSKVPIHYWLSFTSRRQIFPPLILHELGHIFGCRDLDERGSVMFGRGDEFSTTFRQEDIETIKKNKWRKFSTEPRFFKSQLDKH